LVRRRAKHEGRGAYFRIVDESKHLAQKGDGLLTELLRVANIAVHNLLKGTLLTGLERSLLGHKRG